MKNKQKILLWDCETSYTVGATWGLYEQNVAVVLREPYMISFSWKWLGESKVNVLSLPDFPLYKKDKRNDRALIEKLRELFDEADIIIAHNGNSFDQKWAYARFMVHNLPPPSPSKYIDTKVVAKSKAKFNSNSLNNLGQYLNLGKKLETGGIDLWVGCVERDDPKSWAMMCKYNKQDVVLLEKVYLKLRPFIDTHPRLSIHDKNNPGCPKCNSHKVQKRGYAISGLATKKQKYQCQDCGGWWTGEAVKKDKVAI